MCRAVPASWKSGGPTRAAINASGLLKFLQLNDLIVHGLADGGRTDRSKRGYRAAVLGARWITPVSRWSECYRLPAQDSHAGDGLNPRRDSGRTGDRLGGSAAKQQQKEKQAVHGTWIKAAALRAGKVNRRLIA